MTSRIPLAVLIVLGSLVMLGLIVAGIALTDVAWRHGWLPRSYDEAQSVGGCILAIAIIAVIFLIGIVVSSPRHRLSATLVVIAAGATTLAVVLLAGSQNWLPKGRASGIFSAIPFLVIAIPGLRRIYR